MQPREEPVAEPVLEVEAQFYESKREKYGRDYPGQYVLIYGAELIAVCKTKREAIDEGVKRYRAGPFLVRKAGMKEIVLTTFTLGMGR